MSWFVYGRRVEKALVFVFLFFFSPPVEIRRGKKKKKTVVHLVHNKIIMSFILSIKEYIKQNKVFT